MTKYETLKLFDYCIFTSTLDKVNENSKFVINTLNQYSFVLGEKDPLFKEALLASDLLLPDGVGITGAAKILKGKKVKKIAGADLHLHLLPQLNAANGRCFYLGSSEETLSKIKDRLALEFPNIKVGAYSPPFKETFTEAENDQMIEAINAFKPDVLFVGMTAPKQEKWVYLNKGRLHVKIIASIGAVFDFYSGMVKRPGQFWINNGMEWFVRFLSDPNHLWKRYFVYGPVFVYLMMKEKLLKSSNKKV